jgi:DNA-binding Lrp family transcriptional regulator
MASLTSLEARPHPDDAAAMCRLIAKDVLQRGPATSHNLAMRLNLSPYAASKRCSDLVNGGVLQHIGIARNEATGRFASLLGATDLADDYSRGYAELVAPRRTRRDLLNRVLTATRRVSSAGKPNGDDTVSVPMDLMVELHVSLTRYDDRR